MNDLISRQALIEAIVNTPSLVQDETIPLQTQYDGATFRQIEILGIIESMPPAQKEQPAEWVPSTKYKGFLTCSACEDCYIEGWSDKERKWRYCPQCGKRMGRFRK